MQRGAKLVDFKPKHVKEEVSIFMRGRAFDTVKFD